MKGLFPSLSSMDEMLKEDEGTPIDSLYQGRRKITYPEVRPLTFGPEQLKEELEEHTDVFVLADQPDAPGENNGFDPDGNYTTNVMSAQLESPSNLDIMNMDMYSFDDVSSNLRSKANQTTDIIDVDFVENPKGMDGYIATKKRPDANKIGMEEDDVYEEDDEDEDEDDDDDDDDHIPEYADEIDYEFDLDGQYTVKQDDDDFDEIDSHRTDDMYLKDGRHQGVDFHKGFYMGARNGTYYRDSMKRMQEELGTTPDEAEPETYDDDLMLGLPAFGQKIGVNLFSQAMNNELKRRDRLSHADLQESQDMRKQKVLGDLSRVRMQQKASQMGAIKRKTTTELPSTVLDTKRTASSSIPSIPSFLPPTTKSITTRDLEVMTNDVNKSKAIINYFIANYPSLTKGKTNPPTLENCKKYQASTQLNVLSGLAKTILKCLYRISDSTLVPKEDVVSYLINNPTTNVITLYSRYANILGYVDVIQEIYPDATKLEQWNMHIQKHKDDAKRLSDLINKCIIVKRLDQSIPMDINIFKDHVHLELVGDSTYQPKYDLDFFGDLASANDSKIGLSYKDDSLLTPSEFNELKSLAITDDKQMEISNALPNVLQSAIDEQEIQKGMKTFSNTESSLLDEFNTRIDVDAEIQAILLNYFAGTPERDQYIEPLKQNLLVDVEQGLITLDDAIYIFKEQVLDLGLELEKRMYKEYSQDSKLTNDEYAKIQPKRASQATPPQPSKEDAKAKIKADLIIFIQQDGDLVRITQQNASLFSVDYKSYIDALIDYLVVEVSQGTISSDQAKFAVKNEMLDIAEKDATKKKHQKFYEDKKLEESEWKQIRSEIMKKEEVAKKEDNTGKIIAASLVGVGLLALGGWWFFKNKKAKNDKSLESNQENESIANDSQIEESNVASTQDEVPQASKMGYYTRTYNKKRK